MNTNDLPIGAKVRMLEAEDDEDYDPCWEAGEEGTVTFIDNNKDFWVHFGNNPGYDKRAGLWEHLSEKTWCIGGGIGNELEPLEVL